MQAPDAVLAQGCKIAFHESLPDTGPVPAFVDIDGCLSRGTQKVQGWCRNIPKHCKKQNDRKQQP